MGGFCAFDGRGLVWLFVLVFCCCFSTTIIIYFYTINDKYITREGFTEHILPGDEGVRDFFPVMFFVLGVSLFALRSSLRQVCSVRFPVVRRGTGVCLSVFWVAAAVSAGVRCGIRASEALFCRERENLLGTSADGSASHRSGAGCLRVWGCADGSCLMVDSMAVVIYESAPVVVAGCDQVLFRVIKLPVAEGLFGKEVRLHPKMRGCPGVIRFSRKSGGMQKCVQTTRAELKTKISIVRRKEECLYAEHIGRDYRISTRIAALDDHK